MKRLLACRLLLALSVGAYAELQNVEIGGQLRLRGRWWRNALSGQLEQRIPAPFLARRPIGPFGTNSLYSWQRLFTGEAMEDGSFIMQNGLMFAGGTDDDAADYIYFDTQVNF